jgi:hypothetical protein
MEAVREVRDLRQREILFTFNHGKLTTLKQACRKTSAFLYWLEVSRNGASLEIEDVADLLLNDSLLNPARNRPPRLSRKGKPEDLPRSPRR